MTNVTQLGRLRILSLAIVVAAALPTAVEAAGNRAPLISGKAAASATAGKQYVFQPKAVDADGNSLKFTIANRPKWATFNTNTGRLQGVPASSSIQTYGNIVVTVSDGKASARLAAFSIKVEGANAPPVIAGSPATTASIGKQYSFTPAATDANGDSLIFVIENKPAWATFTASTGRLHGTPVAANVGKAANVLISVSDRKSRGRLAAFMIDQHSRVRWTRDLHAKRNKPYSWRSFGHLARVEKRSLGPPAPDKVAKSDDFSTCNLLVS